MASDLSLASFPIVLAPSAHPKCLFIYKINQIDMAKGTPAYGGRIRLVS